MALSPKFVLTLAACLAVTSLPRVTHADLFIADGDRIGRYTDGGTLINANFIALNGVTGLTFGPDNYLYAATPVGGSSGASGIFRYNPTTGAQIDAGPFVDYTGIAQSPSNPQGMHFGSDNHLYVADATLSQVYVFDQTGSFINTLTSPTPANPAGPDIVQPTGLTADALHFYVTSGQGVARFDSGPGTFSNFVAAGVMNNPRDAAFGPDGDLYVLDASSTPQVLRFNSTGVQDPSFHIHLDDLYSSSGIVFYPSNLNFSPNGLLAISGYDAFSNYGTGSVIQYDLNGNYLGSLVPAVAQGTNALTQYNSFLVFSPVPEPSTLALLGVAFCGAVVYRRVRSRRNKQQPSCTDQD